MAAVGASAIWAGGPVFAALVSALAGLMVWEASRMFAAPGAVRAGLLTAVVLALALWQPGVVVLPLLLAAALVVVGAAPRNRAPLLAVTVWVLFGCYAMGLLRAAAGAVWILWLVSVVIVSDLAGYFAGRGLGGPKFWPSISPKKTWSGTIAGWLGAAVIGSIFAGPTGAGLALVPVSVLVGFAGQMGDIAESAAKRLCDVKDSSGLIPGHGGALDRFDAMLGAAVLALILWAVGLLPGVA
jgi:phosphatidate cytidylyltransferase